MLPLRLPSPGSTCGLLAAPGEIDNTKTRDGRPRQPLKAIGLGGKSRYLLMAQEAFRPPL
jgi:hypothetical protein